MATLFGTIPANAYTDSVDNQGTSNAPGASATVAVTGDKTIKRYTGIDAALAFNITGGSLGQTVEVYFANDGVLGRLITWGANIQAVAATLLLTVSKEGFCIFKFNGTKWLLINTPLAL
jgi:hypothetical protein